MFLVIKSAITAGSQMTRAAPRHINRWVPRVAPTVNLGGEDPAMRKTRNPEGDELFIEMENAICKISFFTSPGKLASKLRTIRSQIKQYEKDER